MSQLKSKKNNKINKKKLYYFLEMLSLIYHKLNKLNYFENNLGRKNY